MADGSPTPSAEPAAPVAPDDRRAPGPGPDGPAPGERAAPGRPPRDPARTPGLMRLFNLQRDLEDPQKIDADIRAGVEILGTNLWVLIFAILVASVGLNVNSTAVIIGAMLISPLMGPIVGVGYGLAIHDLALIRKALRTLAIFTGISLGTSALYFFLTPLDEPGTELLARTSPTLWDVLIAFFGGAAGIIALTRRSISNVVPGVAIATALMPPLCTAGFALANKRWDWLGGAIYLYAINSVFIAYATLVFTKLMRLHPLVDGRPPAKTKADWLTRATVVAMIVPSIYLGWRVVENQRYTGAVQAAIQRESIDGGVVVLRRDIDAETHRVHLTVAGKAAPEALAQRLKARLEGSRWPDTRITVDSISDAPVDLIGIRRELHEDVLRTADRQSEEIRAHLATLERERLRRADSEDEMRRLAAEIAAQFPELPAPRVGRAVAAAVAASAASPGPDVAAPEATVLVQLSEHPSLTPAQLQRMQRWLAVRLSPATASVAIVPAGPRD